MTMRTLTSRISAILTLLLVIGTISAAAQKREYVQATAMGTSTQMGRVISVEIIINEYSTDDDKTALLGAFQEKGEKGLVNALDKMKSKGRIAITGTLGYDLNYIRSFPQPDGGRIIRFVTDRPITFGELWSAGRSMDYSLSLGEIVVTKDKGKSHGTLLPVAELKLDKEHHIAVEAYNNPWKLTNIRVSK